MYKLPGQEELLYYMLYAGAALFSMIASIYLLLRRGNAFAPDIKSSARLRRWTAVFFGAMTLSHVWYMPGVFLTSDNDIILHDLVGGLLDSMTIVPLAIIVMLCMLQDSRRPLWPAWVMTAPLAVGMALCIAKQSYDPLPMVLGYFLLMGIGLIIYMVREVRRYGRWLRNNYADLEHKEVWQSFLELAVILLMLSFYVYCLEWPAYEYVVQACDIVLVCYLLWRVEMLSDLQTSPLPLSNGSGAAGEPDATYEYIAPLLQQHCIETQLYLQHDLNLAQLAKVIGTNRFYLSQYFSNQGTTYNGYINGLRISHFVRLYREAIDAHRPFSVQQLALDSGYRSYSTFCSLIKRKKRMSVTAWIKGLHEGPVESYSYEICKNSYEICKNRGSGHGP